MLLMLLQGRPACCSSPAWKSAATAIRLQARQVAGDGGGGRVLRAGDRGGLGRAAGLPLLRRAAAAVRLQISERCFAFQGVAGVHPRAWLRCQAMLVHMPALFSASLSQACSIGCAGSWEWNPLGVVPAGTTPLSVPQANHGAAGRGGGPVPRVRRRRKQDSQMLRQQDSQMLRQQAPRRERVCLRPIMAQLGGEGLVPGARWLGSRLCKPCDSQR